MEEVPRVADYLVISGLPREDKDLHLQDEYSLEVNLKPSAHQEPITDITVIVPSLGETTPDHFQMIEVTPTGLKANLNHGSFRSPEVILCYRRGRHQPPLVDIGVLYTGKDRLLPGSQLVEFTPNNHCANVNNSTTSPSYLTYRRATEVSPCNELVVTDLCVIIASKGETPPHSFLKIDKSLNKGMVGSDVYICYKKSMNRPDLISYKPGVLSRFPLKDNPVYSLEDTVALFCLPMGATLECWPSSATRSSSVNSTFVLTLADRSRIYGSAITFYEEYDEKKRPLSDEQKRMLCLDKYRYESERKIFSNKCVCVLSRWPFFDAFEKYLFFLHKTQLMGPFEVPLERYISHFLYDVPFPSPSRPRILLQLSATDQIALFQPEELPLPRSGASFRNFLVNLGPDNCLLVLLLALTEQNILIHSHRPDVLTSVAEAAMQIIFPFYWQCPYVPLCPIGMSDYLSAPLPFVMGFDSRFFDLYDQPSNVNAVDLDTGTVTVCEEKHGLAIKMLPKKASRQLKDRLVELLKKCHQHDGMALKLEAQRDETVDFDFNVKKREMQLDLEIREAFLHFMVSILSGYRHFLLPITSAPTVGATDVENLFDQQGFLRSRDRNFQKFYAMLTKTQMFTKFIEERSFVSETNTCLAFFDECVDRTENELDPRCLELEGFDSDRTVFILPPDCSQDLPKDVEYKYDTFSLKEDLFPEREATDIDGETDEAFPLGFQTPASGIARRTKQEIRSAQKMARSNQRHPYLWSKCLINTSYSLWFIHLPGYMLANKGKPQTLRSGLALLHRMKKLRLHPADEICYRAMMQLCGEYNQPMLAVKVLFEMKSSHLHPNAVTYGYYNKAVLESKWPEGEASRGQVLWNKLRNVVLAIKIFMIVGREKNFKHSRIKSVSSTAVDAPVKGSDEHDNVSQSSSEPSQESGFKTSLLAEPLDQVAEVPTTPPLDDINEERQIEIVIKGELVAETPDEDVQEEALEDTSTTSIVKSPESEDSHLKHKPVLASTPEVEPESGDVELRESPPEQSKRVSKRLSFSNGSHDGKRGSIHFTHEPDDLGVSSIADIPVASLGQDHKLLLKSQLSEKPKLLPEVANGPKQVTSYTSIRGKHSNLFQGKDPPDTPTMGSTTGKKVNRSLFASSDSKSISDDGLSSPDSGPKLSVVNEDSSFLSTPSSLKKINSSSSIKAPLVGMPLTDNDPLGALSNQSSPSSTLPKSATSQSVEANLNTKPDDNILGSPFAEDKLARSATLPLDQTDSTSNSSLSSSLRSLTKGGMTSKLSSLKKSGSYLSSYLSPGTVTQKKAQEALNQGLTSVKSVYSNASNVLSKRVEDLRDSVNTNPGMPVGGPGMSPASSYQYLGLADRHRDEDAGSTCSTDSRRPSNVDAPLMYMNDQSETWSSLTGQLWDQFWGTEPTARSQPVSNRPPPKASDIIEQFENIYTRLPKKLAGPMAMEIQMTSCSKCLNCHGILYDEEIMSGWTAEDSNLNTRCAFCANEMVPFLSSRVVDYRNGPLEVVDPAQPNPAKPEVEPMVSDHITFPYLSPLVLRKELENILGTEGDSCLLEPETVDSHPIIFWNLLWYFERIGVKSHLPGLCLEARGLNVDKAGKLNETWAHVDHRNIQILCRWDNERFHSTSIPPLYTVWQSRQGEMDSEGLVQIVEMGGQDPEHKAIMNHIIHGVQTNDLLQPIKTLLERRRTYPQMSSPSSVNTTPTKESPNPIPRAPKSVYREMLYLTLVSLGQDNIDLTAFDREYRRAFEKLPQKYDVMVHQCDRPPTLQTLFCRNLFRGLKL
eukprot:snap_masked-scaffold38_size502422-processed-gene-3.3 protein:Tk05877 transcript:snap_masked-scaffold38_size502422-processed-gene-3.3-mRNA-1 annotation:"c-myc promoter-binding protein"